MSDEFRLYSLVILINIFQLSVNQLFQSVDSYQERFFMFALHQKLSVKHTISVMNTWFMGSDPLLLILHILWNFLGTKELDLYGLSVGMGNKSSESFAMYESGCNWLENWNWKYVQGQ